MRLSEARAVARTLFETSTLARRALTAIRREAQRALGPLQDIRPQHVKGGIAVVAVDRQGRQWMAALDPNPITDDPWEWLLYAEGDALWNDRAEWRLLGRAALRRGHMARAEPSRPRPAHRTISPAEWYRRRLLSPTPALV